MEGKKKKRQAIAVVVVTIPFALSTVVGLKYASSIMECSANGPWINHLPPHRVMESISQKGRTQRNTRDGGKKTQSKGWPSAYVPISRFGKRQLGRQEAFRVRPE